MISKQEILNALSEVQEPDLGKDLVSLNMIKNLQIKEKNIRFDIELTTPACPMKDFMRNACINAISLLVAKDLTIEIGFVNKIIQNHSLRLKKIKNIIMVVSGKGGVGKSTVAANVSCCLKLAGARVGLLDADIFGPSLPIMFNVKNLRPSVIEEAGKPIISPVENYGLKLMSLGLLVDEKNAVVWRGPMASSSIKQLLNEVDWGELDYLILDMPPGTSDIHLTLMQMGIVNGAIIVTTPQKVALADAQKGIAMFAQAKSSIPIIGLVENMSFFTPEKHLDEKYYIFGQNGGKNLASQLDIPFLGEIPIQIEVCQSGDSGLPIVLQDTNNLAKESFINVTNLVIRELEKLNNLNCQFQ